MLTFTRADAWPLLHTADPENEGYEVMPHFDAISKQIPLNTALEHVLWTGLDLT